MQSSPLPCYVIPLRPKFLFHTLFSHVLGPIILLLSAPQIARLRRCFYNGVTDCHCMPSLVLSNYRHESPVNDLFILSVINFFLVSPITCLWSPV
jgi:predicted peroxiredoxin